VYLSRGHHNYQVGFAASRTEYGYYESFVRPSLESELGVEVHLYRRNDNTTRCCVHGKKAVQFFTGMGIPLGKKRDASIPKVILESGQIIPFIRGLYHAEGSIYRRYSKQYKRHAKVYDHLLVVQIRMKLGTLMSQVHAELSKLGISTNRLVCKDGVFTLRITSQRDISRFLAIVRPRYKSSVKPARL
jgi:intein/homing endonuclease